MNKKPWLLIWNYLKDWKNLLSHTIVGLLILSIGLLMPVKPMFRILILAIIITLNVFRMKMEKVKSNGD